MPHAYTVPNVGDSGPGWAAEVEAALNDILADGATTAEVASAIATAISNLIGTAPGVLDTLGEISDALADDASFASTMTTALAGKQPLDADLTTIAGQANAAYGLALLTMANAAAVKTSLAIAQADITDNGQVVYTTQVDSYTLVAGDKGTVVEIDKATAASLTVPANASVPFALGTIIEIHQRGAGQVTIVPDAGVTIDSPLGLKISAQYGTASLRKRSTNGWVLSGDTTL